MNRVRGTGEIVGAILSAFVVLRWLELWAARYITRISGNDTLEQLAAGFIEAAVLITILTVMVLFVASGVERLWDGLRIRPDRSRS